MKEERKKSKQAMQSLPATTDRCNLKQFLRRYLPHLHAHPLHFVFERGGVTWNVSLISWGHQSQLLPFNLLPKTNIITEDQRKKQCCESTAQQQPKVLIVLSTVF